jgi:hypothetical protein
MTVVERALKVKFNLWERFGVKRGFITPEILLQAICATGLSKKSRGIKAVISYMMDYRHLGKFGDCYYVIYKRKEKANPRNIIITREENNKRLRRISSLGYDIQHCLALTECQPQRLYPLLMSMLISDMKMIGSALKEKGSCIIKFTA